MTGGRMGGAVPGVVLGLALTLGGLSACSSDDKGPDIPRAGTSTSATGQSSAAAATSTSAAAQVVDGVTLSPEGQALALGQTATVSYQPRQGQTGVLDITVTKLERTSFKASFVGWDLSSRDKKATPYFVHATVTNRGTQDLGGRPVPLYLVDGDNTLVEATSFSSTFKPCKPGHFPDAFGTGATAKVCLVYLAPDHGTLTAVSFRPTQKFNPITWTGDVGTTATGRGKGKGKGGAGGASASPSASAG